MVLIDWINHILFTLLQVSAILGVSLMLVKTSRNASAKALYVTLLAACSSVIIIPLLKISLPSLPVSILPEALFDARWITVAQQQRGAVVYSPVVIVLLAIYFSVFIWRLTAYFQDVFNTRDISRRAHALQNHGINDLSEKLCQKTHLSRHVTLLVSDDINTPMTWGTWKPIILLPREALSWGESALKRFLLHELIHIKRCDWFVMMVLKLIAVVFWFVPGLHACIQKIAWYTEVSCDDVVLAHCPGRAEYAENLLLVAGVRQTPHLSVLHVVETSQVYDRIQAVLDPSRFRGQDRLRVFGVVIGFVLVVLPFSVLTLDKIQNATTHVNYLEYNSSIDATTIAPCTQKRQK